MNNEKVAILVDSGCDIPKEWVKQYDMKVLSLKIIYGSEVFSDGIDIEPAMIYERFKEEIPKTSTPNIQEVIDVVHNIKSEGYEKIIAICISSGLSGTYNTVTAAFESIDDMETFVLDTKNISIGSGFFAYFAAQLLEKGQSFGEVVQALCSKITASKVFYYMDTLEYLRAGGRIGGVKGFIGKALNLKPIISCNEQGVYYTVSIMRGSKNGISKLIQSVCEDIKCSPMYVAILNGAGKEKASEARELIRMKFKESKIILEKQINASLAVHTGPGLVGIGVFE